MEDDDVVRPKLTRPLSFFAGGVLMMIGAGVWFRIRLDTAGVVTIQAPFLFAAGMVMAGVGALNYFRLTRHKRK